MATQETPKTAKYGRKWWVSCAFSARGAREGWDHHALNKTREYEDGRERRGRIRGVFHWRVDIFCLAAPRRRCRDFYCVYGVNATWRAVALSLIRLEPALVNESMRHLVCRLVAKRSSEIGPDSFRHSFTRSWMILDLGFYAGFRSLHRRIDHDISRMEIIVRKKRSWEKLNAVGRDSLLLKLRYRGWCSAVERKEHRRLNEVFLGIVRRLVSGTDVTGVWLLP